MAAQGRTYSDRAYMLCESATDRELATRFNHDVRVGTLSYRSMSLWLLGYPDMAIVDAEHALKHAREIGQSATLTYALCHTSLRA